MLFTLYKVVLSIQLLWEGVVKHLLMTTIIHTVSSHIIYEVRENSLLYWNVERGYIVSNRALLAHVALRNLGTISILPKEERSSPRRGETWLAGSNTRDLYIIYVGTNEHMMAHTQTHTRSQNIPIASTSTDGEKTTSTYKQRSVYKLQPFTELLGIMPLLRSSRIV